MIEIAMPKLSDSMEQGTILSWLKSDGDEVKVGDELVEIETDKATMTYEAIDAGTLTIIAAEGDSLPVGDPIGALAGDGESIRASENLHDETVSPVDDVEQHARDTASPSLAAAAHAEPSLALDDVARPASVRPVPGNGHRAGEPLRVTPLARRVAADRGVDLPSVPGTGSLGRVTRADVLRFLGVEIPTPPPTQPVPRAAPSGSARPAETPPASAGERPGVTRREPTRLQAVIARRMAEAKATIPHFQVQTEVDMDAAVGLRAELKRLSSEDPPPSFNDIIVKACAAALRAHPLANGSWRDGGFELHDAVNVGVAVAAPDALVVPTVFHADTKSLGQIGRETRELAAKVREGSITPPELAGATFTVSNLGMFGMTAITPVVNPPQAAILGVGAMRDTVTRVDGELVDRRLMTLTLSCDHRILYGADAASFLSVVRELLETPLRIAL